MLPDGGQPLGERVTGDDLVDALVTVLARYGRLQRELAPQVGEMLALGLGDMRPASMITVMDPLEWVRAQGVVLQSARGPVPNLAEQIAGEPIRGSWWGHGSGHEIFAVLTRLLESPDVIATRLVDGKVTLVHRRLWSALARVADRFPPERLAAVDEVHTATGAHRTVEVPFPDWVPADDLAAAALLTVEEALALLPACLR